MWRRFRLGLVLAPATAMFLSGCTGILLGDTAGGAGAGTVRYTRGDLEATVAHPRAEVIEASRRAIMSMGITIEEETDTGEDRVFDCVRVDGKSVTARVRELTPSMSRVYIRVGTFGDEAYSWRLMERIEENLP